MSAYAYVLVGIVLEGSADSLFFYQGPIATQQDPLENQARAHQEIR